MRKLALVLCLLPIGACASSGSSSVTLSGVRKMSADYRSSVHYQAMRRRSDGLSNAFGRDLGSIQSFIDRHVWNYDANDPMVNQPAEVGRVGHTVGFLFGQVTGVVGL